MEYPSLEELQKDIPRKGIHEFLLEKLNSNIETCADSVWIATADTGKQLKQSEVEPLSRKIASALIKRGFKRGDSITMFSQNHAYYMLPALAAWRCGGLVSLIGSECTLDGLIAQLNQPKPRYVFCSSRTAEKVLEASATCSFIEEVFTIDSPRDGCTYVEELFQDEGLDCPESLDFDYENDIVFMPFSSGTTGTPKGVAHSHRGISGFLYLMEQSTSSRRFGKETRLQYFNAVSFHHISAFYGALGCLGTNSTFNTLEQYSIEAVINALTTVKPIVFGLHPQTAVALAKDPRLDEYDLKSLVLIYSAGSALPQDVAKLLKEKIPSLIYIGEGYGTTECGSIANQDMFDPLQKLKPTSVGKVAKSACIKIIDPESGDVLGKNQKGEICARTGTLMKGYHNLPEETARAMKDDWYYTGDIGYIDDDGYVYITGRTKEIIKYDVNHVSPTVLESILLQHEAVRDCGVCGLPDEEHGHLPKAFVVRNPQSNTTEQELIDYVNSRVADYEKLRGGLVFVEQIPRNQVGKILRRVLLEL